MNDTADHPSVEVRLHDGPLLSPSPFVAVGAGAVIEFEGVVRPTEEGRQLVALDYEAYEPMTTRELQRLAKRTLTENGLTAIRVEHSVGRVPIGDVSFRLTIASPHRAEAITATDTFILRMKQSIPLWKVAVYAES